MHLSRIHLVFYMSQAAGLALCDLSKIQAISALWMGSALSR